MRRGRGCAIALALAVTTAAFGGCGEEKLTPQNAKFDRSGLYGMCYLVEERDYDPNYSMSTEVQLMKNMGVKSVRQWMHFSNLLQSPTAIREEKCEDMHEMIRLCREAGIAVVGLNHHNFYNGTSMVGKPYARDLGNEEYIKWLDDYYTSWCTLVKEFPEVTYWEIDNEVNNKDFMTDASGNDVYSQSEMAAIATDMFYYATRAIHDSNPGAKSVMGGLTEPSGLGTGSTAAFLQLLYDNIASGKYGYFYGKEDRSKASKNADDYFEIACWHPYVWDGFDVDYFVEVNNEYYQIILDNEGKHKEVFFTEIGFNDAGRTEEETTAYLESLFVTIEEKMPYVTMVHYYKIYDVGTKTSWEGNGNYSRFGLFYDPMSSRTYPRLDGETAVNGAPKSKAYKFQELAGGSGSLELLVNKT